MMISYFLQLLLEFEKHEDILQGNFQADANSSMDATLLGWEYLSRNCPIKSSSSILIVKTTDKVFVETYHLFSFVDQILNRSSKKTLICDIVRSKTIPRNKISEKTIVKHNDQPDFCNGISYMMSPDLVSKFYITSKTHKVGKFCL